MAMIEDTDDVERLAEASAWRVALFEAGVESNARFEAWLAEDGRNADAWAQVSAPWDMFGEQAMAPELIAARRGALERAQRQQRRRFAGPRTLGFTAGRIAAGLVAAVVLGGVLTWQLTKPDVYQTGLGERRAITLADGSHVTLDANTVLKVRLRRAARTLELDRGQARFDVAHDTSRPFTVHALDKTVVATGTSFNVDMMGPKVVVTLIEGRVSILQDRPPGLRLARAAPPPVVLARLVAGQQLTASDLATTTPAQAVAPPRVEVASIERATSWETGQLVFEDEPLASVAARVGRYSDHPLVADPSAENLKVSGVFDAGDLPTFLDAVQRALPVVAETAPDGSTHLRRRGS